MRRRVCVASQRQRMRTACKPSPRPDTTLCLILVLSPASRPCAGAVSRFRNPREDFSNRVSVVIFEGFEYIPMPARLRPPLRSARVRSQSGRTWCSERISIRPDTQRGRNLIAHELAHTVQQDRRTLQGWSSRSALSATCLRTDPCARVQTLCSDWQFRISPRQTACRRARRESLPKTNHPAREEPPVNPSRCRRSGAGDDSPLRGFRSGGATLQPRRHGDAGKEPERRAVEPTGRPGFPPRSDARTFS